MSRNDLTYFNELKKKIVAMMQQSYPGINPSIPEWKGQEITDFQEELRKKVNAHISEKWFYTHMKGRHTSLPRIDMLNLLSKYAGYANWDDFIFKNQEKLPVSVTVKNPNRYFLIIPVVALMIVAIFGLVFKMFNTREYRFCFYDADTREMITNGKIEIRLLMDNESPVNFRCGADGCFHLKTDKSKIKMVVSAQYYQTDTIVRMLKKLNLEETVNLHANDYALMIHYFSMMKIDDWEKRKERLNEMIDDGALIYQVFNDKEATGMALYNKQEFIDKLTMPTGSLKNIEILDSRFRNDKIEVLRFRINDKKK
ncbi:MAG: hypothetical protein WCI71_08780 [Bacteroidota bacterium]